MYGLRRTLLLLILPLAMLACGGGDNDSTNNLVQNSAAPPPPASCNSTVPVGGLTQATAGGEIVYVSAGDWLIKVNLHQIVVTHPNGGYKVETWGDPHENLNGKHIKDWEGDRRTLLMPDGTQLTMHADGPQKVVHTVSIYDGAESHRIDTYTNTVVHSCLIESQADQLEAAEHDGETARVVDQPDGALYFENVYNQGAASDGTPLDKTPTGVPLGEAGPLLGTTANRVIDYYDDPRLGHT